MWIILAIAAIVFAILNLVSSFKGKDPKWFRFISMALTSLSLFTAYGKVASRITSGNILGVAITPVTNKVLLVFTIAMIIVNAISLFKSK